AFARELQRRRPASAMQHLERERLAPRGHEIDGVAIEERRGSRRRVADAQAQRLARDLESKLRVGGTALFARGRQRTRDERAQFEESESRAKTAHAKRDRVRPKR